MALARQTLSAAAAAVGRRRLLAGALVLGAAAGCASTEPGAIRAWIASEREQVFADSPPVFESAVYSAARGAVELNAAINETVAVQLVVSATHGPAGPFQVALSDFRSPEATLPVAAVARIYRARFVPVSRYRAWYADHAGRPPRPAEFPDILIPWEAPRGGGPLRVNGPKNELIWVDLHVPARAVAGDYVGRLELRAAADGATAYGADIVLRVAPVALPATSSLPVIARVDPLALLGEQLRWPQGPPESARLLPDEPAHAAAVRFVNGLMEVLAAHRANPVLAASFPKYRLADEETVELEWPPYAELVRDWLAGPNGGTTALRYWMLPVSADYPDAEQHGGFESPRYARVLAAYLGACAADYATLNAAAEPLVRLLRPAALTPGYLDQLRRGAGIVRQSETGLDLVAHVPAASLRGLGWFNAPEPDLENVAVLAPFASWFEPGAMEQQRRLDRRTWFMPDDPPYSGSLAIEAPAVDPAALAWQAYRYGAQGLWIEDAAAPPPDDGSGGGRGGAGLLHAGAPFGLQNQPAPSIRLKRLRRGLQDYELLRLLDEAGMPGLGQATAAAVVRWAFTEACGEHLLDCVESGWRNDPGMFALARDLVAQEVANARVNDPDGRTRQVANQADWSRMMSQVERVRAEVEGVRLTQVGDAFEARVFVALSNGGTRAVNGRWDLPEPPLGWSFGAPVSLSVPAGARRSATLPLALAGLSYNIDGAYPFRLALGLSDAGRVDVPARLAAAACPLLDAPPTIDGALDDWGLASTNALGDFRLCRGVRPDVAAEHARQPSAATRAFVALDRATLYVAVNCTLLDGDKPLWSAENTIPMDGIVPWGQDVVEVLLNPRNTLQGSPDDLYILQIKPNGLLVARQGPLTDPPVSAARDWSCAARVAVGQQRDAWTIELSLPLASLGAAAAESRVWGFNVTRLDARRGEYSSWSGARGNCYAPTSMGNLVLLRP